MILSDKFQLPGHKLRVVIAKCLDKTDIDIDIYGRCESLNLKKYKGELPNINKVDGLYPYKYSIAIESSLEKNYITEKLHDCILSETLCFYSGSHEADIYYRNAFIRLNVQILIKFHSR